MTTRQEHAPSIDARLGADGVDEVVHVLLCGGSATNSVVGENGVGEFGVMELRAVDTGNTWTVAFLAAPGVAIENPNATMSLATGAQADTMVTGRALDLDL